MLHGVVLISRCISRDGGLCTSRVAILRWRGPHVAVLVDVDDASARLGDSHLGHCACALASLV